MKYSLPIKWISIVTTILLVVIFSSPLESSFKLILLTILVFYITIIRLFATIVIDDEGIQLYTINKVKYEEIKSFKKKQFLGIPHIFIVREKGFGWWLPLYYAEKNEIKETLIKNMQKYPELLGALKCI